MSIEREILILAISQAFEAQAGRSLKPAALHKIEESVFCAFDRIIEEEDLSPPPVGSAGPALSTTALQPPRHALAILPTYANCEWPVVMIHPTERSARAAVSGASRMNTSPPDLINGRVGGVLHPDFKIAKWRGVTNTDGKIIGVSLDQPDGSVARFALDLPGAVAMAELILDYAKRSEGR